MNRTLNSETEKNLKRLRRSGFCAVCNTDKHGVTNATEISGGRWLCDNCADTPTGEFLRGDRR